MLLACPAILAMCIGKNISVLNWSGVTQLLTPSSLSFHHPENFAHLTVE